MPSLAAPSARGNVDAPVDGRPPLLLVAVDISPERGSEPGKAWNWACALSRLYRLHVVTGPDLDQRCREHPAAREWSWHFTPSPQPVGMGIEYYLGYARWCREVVAKVQEVRAKVRAIGLHHVTLGSFRILPRYDRVGLPYTLGPLGGGEVAPSGLLRTAQMPWASRAAEALRRWANVGCALRPAAAAVLRNARLVLTTTNETEKLMRRAGAAKTAIAFPDCTPADAAARARGAADYDRAAALARRVRLVWSGRAVWWKGGQIALQLLRRLRDAGVECELSIFSIGPALEAWRSRADALGLGERCRFRGYVDRQSLLVELAETHGFVYPTMHDSSSSALLEAYAMGVPSLTVGVGGPATVATGETGFNERMPDFGQWLSGAIACVQLWQREPATWLAASTAARARAAEFGPERVQSLVERWLPPAIYAR